jgi:dihydrodipicolinate synthase/N-acetylneuraminate lyase
MNSLDRGTHRGLWAALPTPWTRSGELCAQTIARNCAALASAGVDGIYTTDSDGEFYAIELDLFTKLSRAFGRAMEQAEQHASKALPSAEAGGGGPGRIDAAIGVTWSHTRGVIDRIKAACDAGIPNVHVAFPFFMPLAKSDVERFFDDLAEAVPQARWIHYAHARTGPTLTGADYARLARRFPEQLIGTKLSCADQLQLAEILIRSPELAHLVVDPIMLPGMMLGARGCCSYWVNTLPRWQRRYMDWCLARQWDQARGCHLKLLEWELTHIAPLRAAGHLHGIISKARAALTNFLADTGYTQPPYYPVPPQVQEQLAGAFATYWAEELREESAPLPLMQETAT